MKKNKILLKKHGKKASLNSPNFSVQYSAENQLQCGKNIISALKGNSDLVMVMSTAGSRRLVKNPEDYVESLIELAQKQKIAYRYSKVPAETSGSAIDKLFSFSRQNSFDHQLTFYINDQQWNSSGFDSLRSSIPARYFIFCETMGETVLDTFQNMMDKHKLEICSCVVFDWPEMGQMGISSLYLSYEQLSSIVDLLVEH